MELRTHEVKLEMNQLTFAWDPGGRIKILHMYFEKEEDERQIIVANDTRKAPQLVINIVHEWHKGHSALRQYFMVPILPKGSPQMIPQEIMNGLDTPFCIAEFPHKINKKRILMALCGVK